MPDGPLIAMSQIGLGDDDLALADRLREVKGRMLAELGKVIVGQGTVLEQSLIALFAQGHCLLEGVPGLAKTLVVSSIAKLLSLEFRRIQFTPDLMPSDITGNEILEEEEGTGRRRLKFVPGPIFGNLVLGDEINRAPPKTQAALLQAMQEYKVTAAGVDYPLERPFLVLGTQNPIEQEGTYPLPEAQLDRFMLKIFVDYPSYADELAIARTTTASEPPTPAAVLDRSEILALQSVVRRVLLAESVVDYAVRLARASRPRTSEASAYVNQYVAWGAGPRGYQGMLLAAKAAALLDGRVHVSIDDIRAVAKPVLRHRIVVGFAAESDGIGADAVIDELLAKVAA